VWKAAGGSKSGRAQQGLCCEDGEYQPESEWCAGVDEWTAAGIVGDETGVGEGRAAEQPCEGPRTILCLASWIERKVSRVNSTVGFLIFRVRVIQ